MREKMVLVGAVAALVVGLLAHRVITDDRTVKPETLAERWYKWNLKGKPSGYFHIQVLQPKNRKEQIVLSHEFVVKLRGEKKQIRTLTTCLNDQYYSPLSFEFEGNADDIGDSRLLRFKAEIEREIPYGCSPSILKATVDGRETKKQLPEHVVTDFALFEIIPKLPFKEGVVFKFHSLEATELNLKKNHSIAYVGKEQVPVDNRKVVLHKFVQKGEGISPCFYWVDDKHRLVRVLMDKRKEFLLSTKEKAKKNLGS